MRFVFALAAVLSACLFCSCLPENSPSSVVELTVGGSYKTRYLAGDAFDPTGMTVAARYSDGSVRAVEEYEVSSAALANGTESVKVTYGGASATVRIAVGENPTVNEAFYEALAEEFLTDTYEKDGNTLSYRMRAPDDTSRKAPVILFLHGSGERGNDNEAQLKNAILHAFSSFESMFYDSYVIVPQCPSPPAQWVNTSWTANYSADSVAESLPLSLAYALTADYAAMDGVDADRIYVVGISMGGFGAWDMLVRHGDLFAAGVPICGGGDPTKAEALSKIPIYTFHGTEDLSVPFDTTEEMVGALYSCNAENLHFVVFPGEGHIIWDEAITYPGDANSPPVQEWLFAQRKVR